MLQFMGWTFLRTGSFDNQFFPFFSGGLALYGAVMLGFWLRLKSRYEEKWHEDVKISGREDLNTDAEMEQHVDTETGELVLAYPEWKHRLRQVCSPAVPSGSAVKCECAKSALLRNLNAQRKI